MTNAPQSPLSLMAPGFIESPKNPLIQTIKACHTNKGRNENGLWWVEGQHAVIEALKAGHTLTHILLNDADAHRLAPQLQALADEHHATIGVMQSASERALKAAMTTESPTSVGALVEPPRPDALANWQPWKTTNALILVLDGVQDPGNAGTLLRSAWAFGVTGMVLIHPSVDVSNPKVIRASSGAVFAVPWRVDAELATVMEHFQQVQPNGQILYTGGSGVDAVLTSYREVNWQQPTLLVLGNEGHGIVSPSENPQWITIPMAAGVDSLNVGVCGSILVAEAAAHRGLS
ncbi:MAG: RNA methyltransferase [Vampirovibrionales bacterium]|nr:RNA methyltransferase [Vampirovibrionales bacterium]